MTYAEMILTYELAWHGFSHSRYGNNDIFTRLYFKIEPQPVKLPSKVISDDLENIGSYKISISNLSNEL